MSDSIYEEKQGRVRLVILGTVLIVCLLLVIYLNIYYGIDIVYTHFFYLPILIAGLWYYKKALWVALFLGLFHVTASYLVYRTIVPSTLIRAAIFLIMALAVGVLSEQKDKFYSELKVSEAKLQEQYRDLARQHRELQQTEDEMAVLFEAAQMVNASLNVKQVLDNIVRLAQKVVGFDAGGILLFTREAKEIVYEATYNFSPDEVEALKQCQPFHNLLETLDRAGRNEPVEGRLTCSPSSKTEMAVPLDVNSEIYGVWFVENHREDRFLPDHKKMLATLANLTSSAVKNAWLYERTRFEAIVDQLTGLYNRQYFDHVLVLEKEKARVMQTPLSLIMVDVNRLKYINDTFGHKMGDYIILETAAILKKSVRKGELVFRYGGDEMVILLPGSDYQQTAKVAERIKANLQAWSEANQNERLFLHLSIGWGTAGDAESLEKLVFMADQEMYRDKAEYYKSLGLVREPEGPR